MNVSEGRDAATVSLLVGAGGDSVLDVHSDPHHHRSVLTLGGEGVETAARAVTAHAVARLDIGSHDGVHPRIGVVDVVPFVPLDGSTMDDAVAARDAYLAWIAAELDLPGFAYGPERSLPDVRRWAFTSLAPTTGPPARHPSAGAVCAGARPVLVAYNVWLSGGSTVEDARKIASAVRRPGLLRALGLGGGGRAQVSMNLVRPEQLGPADAFDAVRALASVDGAELVGLLPATVLKRVDPDRWSELDLDEGRTIESRLARAGGG